MAVYLYAESILARMDACSESLPNDPLALKALIHPLLQKTRYWRRGFAACCISSLERPVKRHRRISIYRDRKYVDGSPIYRQEKFILVRLGVDIAQARATTSMWMVRCSDLIQPLINLVRENCWKRL